MAQRLSDQVVDKNGLRGTVVEEGSFTGDSTTQLLVRFENGKQVVIPKEMLKRQGDGAFQLALDVAELLRNSQSDSPLQLGVESEVVIPVVEERLTVAANQTDTNRVEIRKTVEERREQVDLPLLTEEVQVERIALNRPLDEPVAARQEGDTLVIPLLEEVLVVEKRLILREEVRITKVRKEQHTPQEFTLRKEQVEVVRATGMTANE
jgi:uncharacterized protein (TIGR02271 family)